MRAHSGASNCPDQRILFPPYFHMVSVDTTVRCHEDDFRLFSHFSFLPFGPFPPSFVFISISPCSFFLTFHRNADSLLWMGLGSEVAYGRRRRKRGASGCRVKQLHRKKGDMNKGDGDDGDPRREGCPPYSPLGLSIVMKKIKMARCARTANCLQSGLASWCIKKHRPPISA